jgi:hypothetical protein
LFLGDFSKGLPTRLLQLIEDIVYITGACLMESSNLYEELEKFWWFYKNERFDQAAKEINGLLLRTMIAIYSEIKSEAPEQLRSTLNAQERNILEGGELDNAGLEKLARLFQELNVFDIAKGTDWSAPQNETGS